MKFKSDKQRRFVMNMFSISSNEFAKKKFYHGSAGFRGRVIMADGLVPPSQIDMPHSRDEMRGPEFDEYVFLTTDKGLAKEHAERRAIHWGDNKYGPIVYEVELEEEEVVPDTFDPIMYPDSFKYKGIIPSEKVKKVKFSKKITDEMLDDGVYDGYRIKEVKPGVLKDYAGMNASAAKAMGFNSYPIEKDEVVIDERLSPEHRKRVIKHEIYEDRHMRAGEKYWQAHKGALEHEI